MTASRTAAVAFTALTAACATETLITAWWMPWPRLVLAPALLTTLAATCATDEWTALHAADTDRSHR